MRVTLTGDNEWIVDAWVARRQRQLQALLLVLDREGMVADAERHIVDAALASASTLVRNPATSWWVKRTMAGLAANALPSTTFPRLATLLSSDPAGARVTVADPVYAEALADTAAMQDHLREDRSVPIALATDIVMAGRDFGAALDRLRDGSPSDLDDVTSFTWAIVPFHGSGMDSFSRNDCPGALFINWRPGDLDWNVEHLVHENAHGRLNAIQEVCPLWLNPPDATYPSPWRRDPRPIEGIFQATYVFYLTGELLRRLGDEKLRPYFDEQMENLALGRAVLREHAVFSDVGRAFFEQLESGIDGLRW